MSGITAVAIVVLVVYVVLGYKKPGIALTTVPFMAFVIGYASVIADDMANLLFVPIMLLVTLIVIAVSNRRPESREWPHRWAAWILVTVTAIALVVAVFAVFETIGAGPVLPLFLFLGIIGLIASLIGSGISSRKTVAINVITTLGSSMKQNLPLPMALECAAFGRDDAVARTLRRIKKWLVQGYSLAESLRRGYPQCSSRALAMLTAGERLGQLPAAFDAVKTDLKAQMLQRDKVRPVHPAYPVVMLAIMFLLVVALMGFVIPTFKVTLEEMIGGQLPGPTRVLFEAVSFLVYETHTWILLVLVPFSVLLILLFARFGRRRPEEPFLLSQLGDFVKWHLPIIHWFENNYSMLQVIELLRLSLNAGCPVDEAIAGTLELDVNLHFKKRLRCWRQRVESGGNIAQAARACGLGTALAWAFDTSGGAIQTPAVLEMLESFYRSNYSYRVNLARFILWPCGIIALGLTVGFVVLAIFLPIVTIITGTASYVYP